MQTPQQFVEWSADRLGRVFSLLVSFVAHLSLLLLLAFWIYLPGKPGAGVTLTSTFSRSEDVQLELRSDELVELNENAPPESVRQPNLAVDLQFEIQPEHLERSGSDEHLAALSASAKSFARPSIDSNSEKTRGAAFFGAYAAGERFVYVIDSSTSMTGDRWLYACSQLIDSLQQLKPTQEFYVISFDVKPGFLLSRGNKPGSFQHNDTTTIAKVRSWLKTKMLGRGTRPAKALEFALSMKPDAIFLLSDGELQDDTVFRLRRLNQSDPTRPQIPIHSVHLFSLDGRATLQLIAYENGGTFTPIGQR